MSFTNMEVMNSRDISRFQRTVWDYFRKNKRDFEWRNTRDPYRILVSEVMLQQTQTERVKKKYEEFIHKFPTVQSLADASLAKVLEVWQGLGYNRRGVYLKKSAEYIRTHFGGRVPVTSEELVQLPGIGPNTAGAILAFAYNVPVVFIETNIRRVYIHHFFSDRQEIHDNDIKLLIEQTLPKGDFRDWYYALMDYGVYLAKGGENPNRKSKHYSIQTNFEGSRRQLRSKILKMVLRNKTTNVSDITDEKFDSAYIDDVIQDLVVEGVIVRSGQVLTIAHG